jgi:hypothetical protein
MWLWVRDRERQGSAVEAEMNFSCALDRLLRGWKTWQPNLRLRTVRASRALSKNSSPAIGLKRDVKRVGARRPESGLCGIVTSTVSIAHYLANGWTRNQ